MGRDRTKKIVQQEQQPKTKQRREEWAQKSKNVRENAIKLGFKIHQTGNKLRKTNINVRKQ